MATVTIEKSDGWKLKLPVADELIADPDTLGAYIAFMVRDLEAAAEADH